MSNIFIKTAKKITLVEIHEIEKKLKITLPDVFKDFYLNNNGGVPQKNFYIPPGGEWDAFDIQEYNPLKYPLYKKGGTIEDDYNLYINEKKLLPSYLIPFAQNNTGDPYCVNMISDEIYFFSIDDYLNLDEALIFMSPNIKIFSKNLITEVEAYG